MQVQSDDERELSDGDDSIELVSGVNYRQGEKEKQKKIEKQMADKRKEKKKKMLLT